MRGNRRSATLAGSHSVMVATAVTRQTIPQK